MLVVELIAVWCIEAATAGWKQRPKRHIRYGSVQTLGHLETTSRTGRGDRSDAAILRKNFRSDRYEHIEGAGVRRLTFLFLGANAFGSAEWSEELRWQR